MLLAVVVGFLFGFIGSVPVAGPIAMLVLRLGLNHDVRHARNVAIGGAVAEAGYALLAFWGLSSVLARHPRVLPATEIAGAAICLILGTILLLNPPSAPRPREEGARTRGLKRSLAGGFLITALNPTLVVTWTAALTALHATGLFALEPRRALPFAAGVLAGILGWFATLLSLVRKYKERWSPEGIRNFIRFMGGALAAGGAYVGIRAALAFRAG